MTASTAPSSQLRMLPLELVRVEDGFNPRNRINDATLGELTESIRQHGVLQPIVVSTAGEGDSHTVIAGHRRLEAARAAGLVEIPAIVRTNGDALTLAVIENLQREDLNPIEQASAFERALKSGKLSQKALAERLNISAALVAERLRLLRLPEDVQQAIAEERLPLRLAKPLETIAKVSSEVASACAAVVAAGICKPHELEEEPAGVVDSFARVEWTGKPPCAVRISCWSHSTLEDLPIDDVAEDIRERAAKLDGGFWFSFGEEDADAARAYGCLLEFRQDRHFRSQFITDRSFIEDRLRLHLGHVEERQAEQARWEGERTARSGQAHRDADTSADHDKVDRKAEHRAREQAKRDAHSANLELGRKLIVAYGSASLTKDAARLLALLVLDAHKDLAGRGLRYSFEDWQEIESTQLKNGSTRDKVTYLERWEAQEKLYAWIGRARSPEEILGRLLQAVIAAGCADQHAVAQGSRVYHELPGSNGAGPSTQIPMLVERLAKRVLPRRLAEQARERRADHERYAVAEKDAAGEIGDEIDADDEAEVEQ